MVNQKAKRIATRVTRKGIAATEAAVTLPVVIFLIFSMLQICHLIYLRQKVTAATYVGMQQLVQASADEASVIDTVTQLLESRSINGATITITPQGILGTTENLEVYTLRVEAPLQPNLPSPHFLPVFGNVVVEQSVYR